MFILLMLLICLLGICYGLAVLNGSWPFEGMSLTETGVFGDSWGAFTSIFSALGFCGVLWTIKLQIDATKKIEANNRKREEAEILRDFENTFFNMLNLLQSIINGMQVTDRSTKEILAEGRNVFLYYYRNFKSYIVEEKKELTRYKELSEDKQLEVSKKLGSAYELYFSSRTQNLSHYFRFLFNTYKFIDESNLKPDFKKKYANILRAQISNYELLLLFYNSHASYGVKFKYYFEKYHILDNTPIKKLIYLKHARLVDRKCWGDNILALKVIDQ